MRSLRYNEHLFISYDPVITTYTGVKQFNENSRAPELPECIQPGIILECLSWHASENTIRTIKKRYDSCEKGIDHMLVVNTAEEEEARVKAGVAGFCCNAEIYQMDYFATVENRKHKYDAIYNARFSGFKRHHLSNKIKNLRVLTGGMGNSLVDRKGLETIDSSSHGSDKDLKNKSVSFDLLNSEEVAAEIHQSSCGLALSAVEGMMRASTEYLLCGRPVVSTRSSGGRDIYYNSDNCKIVDDDPEAVLQGVQYWLDNPPDRKLIRRRVLAQLNSYRYAYCRKISQLQLNWGGHPEIPERIFYDLFINSEDPGRRFHSPDSQITEKQLRMLLVYPEIEILFRQSHQFKIKNKAGRVYLQSEQSQVILDELSGWILSQLDGLRTITEIINELVVVYGGKDRINEDVRDTIARFIDLGAVVIANQVE